MSRETSQKETTQPNNSAPTGKAPIVQPALTDLIPFSRPRIAGAGSMITPGNFTLPTDVIHDSVTGVGASARGRGSQTFLRLAGERNVWATTESLSKCAEYAAEHKITLKSWNDFIGKNLAISLKDGKVTFVLTEAPKRK